MARLSKEEMARREGARWALDLVKKDGIEKAEQELEYRGIYNIPCGLNNADLTNFSEGAKRNCVETVCLMAAYTLRDEFEFGKQRLDRFVKRFNDKADSLLKDYNCWDDIREIMKDETGIEFFIPDKCRDVKVNSIGVETRR